MSGLELGLLLRQEFDHRLTGRDRRLPDHGMSCTRDDHSLRARNRPCESTQDRRQSTLRHSTKDEERRNRDGRGLGPPVGLALLVQLPEQGARVISPLLLHRLRGLNPGTFPVPSKKVLRPPSMSPASIFSAATSVL